MEPSGPDRQYSHSYRFVILATAVFVVFAAIGLARFGYTMLLPFMEKTLPLTKEEGVLLAYFLYGFSYIIYATFSVAFLIQERQFDAPSAGGLWFIAGVASIASGLVWGALSDRIGRKRALRVIYCLMAAAYGLFGLAEAAPLLYVSAFLFALCSWSVPAVMAAATGDLLGPERAPMGFGVLTFSFGLGQALGPTVAGLLARPFGSYTPGFILAAAVSWGGAVLLLFVRKGMK
jgi:MFS family permease